MMNSNKNGSFKPKRIYFSQVSNTALRDKKLSLQAKGLYSLIQSYLTIENFTLYKNHLEKQSSNGKNSFDSAWKELKIAGYLVQEKHNDGSGHFYYIYDLLDVPHTDFPDVVKPDMENRGHIVNTDYNNTKEIILKYINVVAPNGDNIEFYNSIFNYYFDTYKKYMGKNHPLLSKNYVKQIVDSIDVFSDEYGLYHVEDWEQIINMYFNSNLDCDRNMIHFAQPEILYNRADNCKLVGD